MSEYPDHIIFFDGVCNLCNASVQFIIRHDHQKIFRFASLQSDTARRLLGSHIEGQHDNFETILFWDHGNIYSRSDAVLRIAGLLPFPWKMAKWNRLVPRFIRDRLYMFISRNRYRWFGRKDQCMIPTPDLKSRFLP